MLCDHVVQVSQCGSGGDSVEGLILSVGDSAMLLEEGNGCDLPVVQIECLQKFIGELIHAQGEREAEGRTDDLGRRQFFLLQGPDDPFDPGSVTLHEAGTVEDICNLRVAEIGIVFPEDHLDGDTLGETTGVVEADSIVKDPDLRLDGVVEVVPVNEGVEQGLPDRRERVFPDLLPLEGLLHRLPGDVVADADIVLDDSLCFLELDEEVAPDLVVADDDVGPPEPPDPDDGIREICLRVLAEENDGAVGDASVPDKAEAPEDGIERFVRVDDRDAAGRAGEGEKPPDALPVDLIGVERPGDAVPFNALLEEDPQFIGEHLAGGVADTGVVASIAGDRGVALLDSDDEDIFPFDLAGLDDRVDAKPAADAVCEFLLGVVPQVDAGDGVVAVPDTDNGGAAGGVGESGEEFIEGVAHLFLEVDPPSFKTGEEGGEVIRGLRLRNAPGKRGRCYVPGSGRKISSLFWGGACFNL